MPLILPMYLVTGGNGFIGAHLVSHLCERGNAVRVLDVRKPNRYLPSTEYQIGSILDAEALKKAMAGVKGVFHLAGIAQLWRYQPDDYWAVNVQGTQAILHAIINHKEPCRLVHVSTESLFLMNALHGVGLPPLESMAGPYTRSKWQAHDAVRRAAASRNVDACIASPAVPIGRYDWGLTPPTRMLQGFLEQRHPAYLNCLLNLISVEDIAHALVNVMVRGECGGHYVLSREAWWLSDILSLMEGEGVTIPKRMIPYSLARISASVMESYARLIGGESEPDASVEGVRLVKKPVDLTPLASMDMLGHPKRTIGETLKDAIIWIRELGAQR